jgi:hypothetical protein
LKDQLRYLEELQRFDARLQEHESALKTLPEKLQALKNDLAKVEAMLAKERQALADTEKFRRELELQLKTDEANVAKSKAKMSQVKTGKDYMAAQREMESTRKTVGEREEELVRLIDAIESSKKAIETHEKDVSDLRAVVAREEEATASKLAEVRGKVDAERVQRDEVAKQVRQDILKKYGTIRLRRGLAVVPVVKGTCQGCHMAIPPQLYNILQRGTSVETCPTCNRIIYWDEMMKDKELDRGEQGEPSA